MTDVALKEKLRGFIFDTFMFSNDLSGLADDASLLEMGVIDSTGVLEPVEPGQAGTPHVRGPHVMKGYRNRSEENREMLWDGEIDGGKVLPTGDWFRMDPEGFFHFLGQTRKAFVVRNPGADLDERSARKALLARLEIYMVPREFVFRESLPKSANGRILRKELV